MPKTVKIILIVAGVLVVLLLAKNIIAQTVISAGAKAITGLGVSTESMGVGVFKTAVDIKGLKVYNPSDFPEKLMLDMPEAYVNYDLGAIIGGKVHLRELRIDIKEFIVVKDSKGRINLDSLKSVQEQKKAAKKDAKKSTPPKIQMDSMSLKIGKVTLKDYSRGTTPSVTEFSVNINEQYKNITDPYAVGSLIVFKALMNTTIASITNFDLGLLKEGLSGTLKGATGIAFKAVGNVTQVGGDTAKTAADAAKAAAEGITGIFPFGKKE